MDRSYVGLIEGRYVVASSQVSLVMIVRRYLDGEPPEGIAASLPGTSLEDVFGSLAYYFGHKEAIDPLLPAKLEVGRLVPWGRYI